MNRLGLALGVAALLAPAAASAEPISVSLGSSSGVTQTDSPSTGWFAVNLGTYDVSSGAVWYLAVDGLKHGSDYTTTMSVNGSGWSTLTAEILDPSNDGDDTKDVSPQPSYVPAGFSTSNTQDGFSFAQSSALDRSVVWASGSGNVVADEQTNARDMLTFTGLGTQQTAMLNFGLRDRIGDRNFLIRFSTNGPNVPVPEPASMLLVGTALAGLGTAFRRRFSA